MCGIYPNPDHSWLWESLRNLFYSLDLSVMQYQVPGGIPQGPSFVDYLHRLSQSDLLNLLISLCLNIGNELDSAFIFRLIEWLSETRQLRLLSQLLSTGVQRVPRLRAFARVLMREALWMKSMRVLTSVGLIATESLASLGTTSLFKEELECLCLTALCISHSGAAYKMLSHSSQTVSTTEEATNLIFGSRLGFATYNPWLNASAHEMWEDNRGDLFRLRKGVATLRKAASYGGDIYTVECLAEVADWLRKAQTRGGREDSNGKLTARFSRNIIHLLMGTEVFEVARKHLQETIAGLTQLDDQVFGFSLLIGGIRLVMHPVVRTMTSDADRWKLGAVDSLPQLVRETALVVAAESADYDLARNLLEHKTDPNVRLVMGYNDRRTLLPIDAAFSNCNIGFVNLLLSWGSPAPTMLKEISARTKENINRAFDASSYSCHLEWTRGLWRSLDRSFSTHLVSMDADSTHLAFMDELSEILIRSEHRASVENVLLLWALFRNTTSLITKLVNAGLDIRLPLRIHEKYTWGGNQKSTDEEEESISKDERSILCTPLQIAANTRATSVVEHLWALQAGFLQIRDESPGAYELISVLQATDLLQRYDLGEMYWLPNAQFLIERGANLQAPFPTRGVNARSPLDALLGNSTLYSFLHLETHEALHKLVKSMLDAGCPVDGLSSHLPSPLQRATETGLFHVMRLLIDFGANVNLVKGKGKGTDYPAGRHCLAMILKPKEPRRSSDYKDFQNTKNGHRELREVEELEVFQYLLSNGADANAIHEEQETVLGLACRKGELEFARALVDYGADVNAGWWTGNNDETFTPLESTCLLYTENLPHGPWLTLDHINSVIQAGADLALLLAQNGAAMSLLSLLERDLTNHLRSGDRAEVISIMKGKRETRITEMSRRIILRKHIRERKQEDVKDFILYEIGSETATHAGAIEEAWLGYDIPMTLLVLETRPEIVQLVFQRGENDDPSMFNDTVMYGRYDMTRLLLNAGVKSGLNLQPHIQESLGYALSEGNFHIAGLLREYL